MGVDLANPLNLACINTAPFGFEFKYFREHEISFVFQMLTGLLKRKVCKICDGDAKETGPFKEV